MQEKTSEQSRPCSLLQAPSYVNCATEQLRRVRDQLYQRKRPRTTSNHLLLDDIRLLMLPKAYNSFFPHGEYIEEGEDEDFGAALALQRESPRHV